MDITERLENCMRYGTAGQGVRTVLVAAIAEINRLRKELADARAIIDKLPKTADGVPVCLDDVVYYIHPTGRISSIRLEPTSIRDGWWAHRGNNASECVVVIHVKDSFSTREAAERAAEGNE